MIATRMLPLVSLLLSGAIFGFFYAWVCSTMWGLDAGSPSVAIPAMQAMNASVRNPVFFPAFFLTPVVLAITAAALIYTKQPAAGWLFGIAAVVYGLGCFAVTALVNVPMNEALALVVIPDDPVAAGRIWQDYSGRWQYWNVVRTLAAAVSLTLTGAGLLKIERA